MEVPWIYDAVAQSHLIWLNAKNCRFLHVTPQKKIQVPADRTILMPAAQPIGHFEIYAPKLAPSKLQSQLNHNVLKCSLLLILRCSGLPVLARLGMFFKHLKNDRKFQTMLNNQTLFVCLNGLPFKLKHLGGLR